MPTNKQAVILVEDDPLISDLYDTILTTGGYTVKKSLTSIGVLEMVEVEKPDLIVLDLMMPQMDGMEVLSKLKATPATKTIPVILFTNLVDPAKAKEALEKGAARYALKNDYSPKTFLELVKEVLNESSLAQAA